METVNQYIASESGIRTRSQSTRVSTKLFATGKGMLALLAILAATYWLAPFEAEVESTIPVAERALQ